jgi:hypothetical protein
MQTAPVQDVVQERYANTQVRHVPPAACRENLITDEDFREAADSRGTDEEIIRRGGWPRFVAGRIAPAPFMDAHH